MFSCAITKEKPLKCRESDIMNDNYPYSLGGSGIIVWHVFVINVSKFIRIFQIIIVNFLINSLHSSFSSVLTINPLYFQRVV